MHRIVVLAVIVLAACADVSGPISGDRRQLVVDTANGDVTVTVEIADTPSERATGLMHRTSLGPDAGMAFLWAESASGPFWMKDTLIPLSIAFWDHTGRILSIIDMEPCTADPCPSYDPGVTYAGAVEVEQGFFDRHGVHVGDRVTLRAAR